MSVVRYIFSAAWREAGLLGRLLYVFSFGLPTMLSFVAGRTGWDLLDKLLPWWGWLIVAVFAALAGLLYMLGRHSRRLEEDLRPRLEILFQPTRPWVNAIIGNVPPKTIQHTSGSSTYAVSRIGARNAKCLFVRFEVRAATDVVVRGCTAWINDVERSADGEWRPTEFSSSLRLRWVSDQSYGPHDVPSGARMFVDLFSTDEINKKILVKWETGFIANEKIFSNKGKYRITVFVSPEQGEITQQQFIVDWRDDWENFDVEMVDGNGGTITWPEVDV